MFPSEGRWGLSQSVPAPAELGFMMAALMGILSLFCVSVCRRCAALPVLRPVRVGQNATLSCNLTSSAEVTWYLVRADQLLPLLTVRRSRLLPYTVDGHAADTSRFYTERNPESGSVGLEIVAVTENDTGLYVCAGRCAGAVCVDRGVLLTVAGSGAESGGDEPTRPCWSLGICVAPVLITIGFVLVAGFHLCTGKPAACCCSSARGDTEASSVHRPSVLGRREDVTYSAVMARKKPDGPRDHRPLA